MNRMYGTAMYFYGRAFSCILFYWIYPITVAVITFFATGVHITLINFIAFLGNAFLSVFNGAAIGFLIGVSFNNT